MLIDTRDIQAFIQNGKINTSAVIQHIDHHNDMFKKHIRVFESATDKDQRETAWTHAQICLDECNNFHRLLMGM